jgi:hypothetical protein
MEAGIIRAFLRRRPDAAGEGADRRTRGRVRSPGLNLDSQTEPE